MAVPASSPRSDCDPQQPLLLATPAAHFPQQIPLGWLVGLPDRWWSSTPLVRVRHSGTKTPLRHKDTTSPRPRAFSELGDT